MKVEKVDRHQMGVAASRHDTHRSTRRSEFECLKVLLALDFDNIVVNVDQVKGWTAIRGWTTLFLAPQQRVIAVTAAAINGTPWAISEMDGRLTAVTSERRHICTSFI
jgi:hypothetical protein